MQALWAPFKALKACQKLKDDRIGWTGWTLEIKWEERSSG